MDIWPRTDFTGHWRVIRIESDPPLPSLSMMERLEADLMDSMRRGLEASLDRTFIFGHRPDHEVNYEIARDAEQWRAECACAEQERANEISRIDAIVANLTGALAAVAAIHARNEDGECIECEHENEYETWREDWPCRTVKAAIGES